MARAIDPQELDPDLRITRSFDDAWRTDLRLIRELSLQERQAEEDRALAARLAGITINEVSEDIRRMAMLLDDFDDDSDNEKEETEGFSHATTVMAATTGVSTVQTTAPNLVKSKP
ncbi:unnamed protein product [Didymodactylos carnosus]|uniref:Uncharacterized protein n=1 Tax=Didymodactylos carnosus TaxID=1234261 RepID=A0A814D6R7_9BILA|nr:unnamed protein product [Didymodactylos carnosus]CAF1197825.1 unnamed protein product [Didymodactylos carnosus]CAF3725896.1 unnamed protein product [Didymodactylos carnosus]CAF4008001.1 unnamed protein product [Didymodactylos carnosus]